MTKRPVLDNLILLVLLLAAMNIFLGGSYLILAAFALLMFRDRKLVLDKTSFLLCTFAAIYILFYAFNNGASTSLFRVLVLPVAYIMGFSLAANKGQAYINRIVVAISCAMALHSFINLFYNISFRGIEAFRSGISYDFWSRSISSATGQASYYFFLVGMLPFLLFSYGALRNRLVLIAAYFLALIHDLLLGGRTFLVLTMISCAYGVSMSFIFSQNRKKFVRVLLILAGVLLAVHLAYSYNLFGIQEVVGSSYFYHRFVTTALDITESGRFQRRMIYIQNILQYPFGGSHIRIDLGIGYAHDLWLDVFDDAGIIAMIFLCCYTIGMVVRLLRYLQNNKDYNSRLLIGGVMITVLISFFSEPILAACPINLAIFCLIDGMLTRRMGQIQ